MDEPKSIAPGTAVTGNFQLNAQMLNGKTFSVSGYLYDGESVESVNQRVDHLHDVMDRQRTRAEIPDLEAKFDQTTKQLQQMKEVMADLERKRNDSGKLSSQEKLTLQNMGQSIVTVQENLVKGDAAIKEAKRKVGVV
jgi:chromosome segregation ATPase